MNLLLLWAMGVSILICNVINTWRHKRIVIDAFTCISIGFIYYWVIPACAMLSFFDLSSPEFGILAQEIGEIPEAEIFNFSVIGILMYLSFFIGFVLIKRPLNYPQDLREKKPSRKILFMFLIVSLILTIASAYFIRDQFFQGYAPELFEGYSEGVLVTGVLRGQFIAYTLLVFVIVFIWVTYFKTSIKAIIFNPYTFLYFMIAFLGLSLGGRLYFLTTVLIFAVYISTFKGLRITLKRAACYLIILTVLLASYGAIRAGESFSLAGVATNLMLEPLLTSLSLFSFLAGSNEIFLGRLDILLSDFVNLIPSFFFTDKGLLLIDPRGAGYNYVMPLGGMHLYVSGMIKLGAVLFVIVAGFMGLLMGILEMGASRHNIYRIIYSMIAGWLAFSLQRDPFSVSLVKNMFEFSILLPLIIVFISKALTLPQKRVSSKRREIT